jgi:hypothetical protein
MNRDALLEIAKEDENLKEISEHYDRARDVYERTMTAMGRRSKTRESVISTENAILDYEQSGSPEITIG